MRGALSSCLCLAFMKVISSTVTNQVYSRKHFALAWFLIRFCEDWHSKYRRSHYAPYDLILLWPPNGSVSASLQAS